MARITEWAASSEFGTYRQCEQRRFRRACASAQSRQNLRCSLIQAVSQEGPSDRKPDSWPLWMAGHAQLKFVMTECWKTQIRLTRPKYCVQIMAPEWQTLDPDQTAPEGEVHEQSELGLDMPVWKLEIIREGLVSRKMICGCTVLIVFTSAYFTKYALLVCVSALVLLTIHTDNWKIISWNWCPWARHFTPRKYWLITQEAMAPSWHDWKIVDWDVKPQHKQTNHETEHSSMKW